MSALAEKLQRLSRQAGQGAPMASPARLPAPAGAPSPTTAGVGTPIEGLPATGAWVSVQVDAAVPGVAPQPVSAPPLRAPRPASDDAPEAIVARLRQLLRLRAPGGAAPRDGGIAARVGGVPARTIDRALPGEEIAAGLHYTEHWTPWPRGPAVVALQGIGIEAPIARERLLAFDTETTGLAGGTGTRAFMVGAADWRDGGLRVRQLCIATLGAEVAMLQAFARWLDEDTVLVSYNGKSYDRPLLSTRYRLARLRDPLLERTHVDLLHPVRRRYRGTWANCRLATVERELLGIVREDDLPGSEAPGAWLSFLRGGSAHTLRRVGAHNAQDVRSLCTLLEAMADPAIG